MIPMWTARYIGIPFAERGRDRFGADCWGLYRLVRAEQWGDRLDGYEYGTHRDDHAYTIRREREWSAEVAPGRERCGDAVFLRAAGIVCHVGMVLEDGMMLHTRRGTNAAIESYTRGSWSRRVESFRRP